MTLPLSYSRLRVSLLTPTRPAIRFSTLARAPKLARDLCERGGMAREGLEPSKPLGRQIYSLLRLTASLPRQLSVCWKRDVSGLLPTYVGGAGEGI